MKNLITGTTQKKLVKGCLVVAMLVLMVTPVFADGYDSVVNPVISLINNLLGPVLGIVGAVGALYCVLLGVKFAKAEEPQEREKAKTHLKNAIIGFVLIFVLLVMLKIGMGVMINWANENGGNIQSVPSGT